VIVDYGDRKLEPERERDERTVLLDD